MSRAARSWRYMRRRRGRYRSRRKSMRSPRRAAAAGARGTRDVADTTPVPTGQPSRTTLVRSAAAQPAQGATLKPARAGLPEAHPVFQTGVVSRAMTPPPSAGPRPAMAQPPSAQVTARPQETTAPQPCCAAAGSQGSDRNACAGFTGNDIAASSRETAGPCWVAVAQRGVCRPADADGGPSRAAVREAASGSNTGRSG